MIDLRNSRIDHCLGVFRYRDLALQDLRDKFLDDVLSAFLGRRFAEAAFLNDLIEQTCRFSRTGRFSDPRSSDVCSFGHPYASSFAGLAASPNSLFNLSRVSVLVTA